MDDEKQVFFSPVRSKRTFEEVSIEIKKMIIKGVFKAGDRLPSENELSRQFSVGRQTVREAMRLLELSGFLTVQRGGSGGPVIRNTILDTLTRSFIDAIQMRSVSVQELTEARLGIETLALQYVMKNGDEGLIAALRENIRAAKEKIRNKVQAFDKNIYFHVLLAKASKNQVVVIMVEAIMALVADFLSRIPQTLEISRRVCEEHEAILDAVAERNEERVLTLMKAHLKGINDEFEGSFEALTREGLIGERRV
jgi:DNA-binding FadR family transcriptional regulator